MEYLELRKNVDFIGGRRIVTSVVRWEGGIGCDEIYCGAGGQGPGRYGRGALSAKISPVE